MKPLTRADLANILRRNPDVAVVDSDRPRAHPAPSMSEHDLQCAVIAECDRRAVHDSRYGLIFAIPNGGQRHRAVAAKLKAEGVRAGVPDLFLAYPSRGFHGLFIELKVGRNQLTGNQRQWATQLKTQGYRYFVGYDDPAAVLEHIEWYLGEQTQ